MVGYCTEREQRMGWKINTTPDRSDDAATFMACMVYGARLPTQAARLFLRLPDVHLHLSLHERYLAYVPLERRPTRQ